ncbi:hypothetical protein C8Q75DRAFT_745435 [Abortiporus biennis]|nr:hypothetical protein C8Q75DRAFT_745435 [Abortiporus biennis]
MTYHPTLPTELWFQVLEEPLLNLRDRQNIVIANKLFAAIAQPLLYRTLKVHPCLSKNRAPDSKEWFFSRLGFITQREDIARAVRSVVIRTKIGRLDEGHSHTDYEADYDMVDAVFKSLASFPNIKTFVADNIRLSTFSCLQLSRLSNLAHLHLRCCPIHGDASSLLALKLDSFTLDELCSASSADPTADTHQPDVVSSVAPLSTWWLSLASSGVRNLRLTENIEKYTLPWEEITSFTPFHTVRRLELHDIMPLTPGYVEFLAMFPCVEEFASQWRYGVDADEAITQSLPSDILPKLTHVSVRSAWLSSYIENRPVRTIVLTDPGFRKDEQIEDLVEITLRLCPLLESITIGLLQRILYDTTKFQNLLLTLFTSFKELRHCYIRGDLSIQAALDSVCRAIGGLSLPMALKLETLEIGSNALIRSRYAPREQDDLSCNYESVIRNFGVLCPNIHDIKIMGMCSYILWPDNCRIWEDFPPWCSQNHKLY